MNQLIGNRILVVMGVCFGIGYPFYCWVAQAGLLRWLMYLELWMQGKGPYTVHSSLLELPATVLTWGAILVLSGPAQFAVTHLLPPPPVILNETAKPAPAPAQAPSTAPGKALAYPVVRWLFAGSVLLIAVGVGAGIIGYRKTPRNVTFETLNLADNKPPSSRFVKLTGMAMPNLMSQYSESIKGSSFLETYIPVVAPNWRQGDPVVYFIHPFRNTFSHLEPAMVSQTGVLLPNALTGPALFICKKHGLNLANPSFVLEKDPQAGMEPYLYTVIFSTIIGLCLFIPIAWNWISGFFQHSKLPS
jgi:hypothetical protein